MAAVIPAGDRRPVPYLTRSSPARIAFYEKVLADMELHRRGPYWPGDRKENKSRTAGRSTAAHAACNPQASYQR